MAEHRSRRRVLRGVGAVACCSALAGCGSLLGPDGLRLGDVRIQNADESAHTVAVTIARDGETVHDRTYDVPAGTATTIQASWADEPAVYEIEAVVDGETTLSTELTGEDAMDESCTIVYVHAKPTSAPPGLSIGPPGDHPDADCSG